MSYSRRQLEALGEMLGECVTRKEGGRIIYGGGGGGGGGGGTTTTVSDLPDWAKGSAQKVLAGTEALTFQKDDQGNITGLQPYQQYTGERTAQFTPLQKQAFEGAQGLGPTAATYAGQNAAMAATQGALNTQYNPMMARNQYQGIGSYAPSQFQNQFQAPDQYQAGQFGVQQVFGPELQQYQMGPAQQVRADTFGGRQAAQYMSPYIEQAMEPQLREAQRSSEMQRNMDQATAVSKGAFGGSRQAIVEAERQRNLGTQLGDIRAKGLQSAYEQAQNQFNQDAARRLQAQQLNQQAGLTTGQQNLAALLNTQQLGAQTGMQAQLANQQYGLEAQRMAEQSRQFGAGQGLTAAQLQAQYGLSADQANEASRQFSANQAAQQAANRAQYGQAAQQLTEQSRQYGAGLGLQGLQTALTGAGQLGSLGSQEFGQQKEALGLQNQFGTQQQQQIQNILSQQYQDFQNQQKYPYQQLEFLSSMVRGTPTGQVQTMYGAQPTAIQSLGSLGMGAYGLSQLMRAGGGSVSSYADGGSVTDERHVESILSKLSDAQLQQAAEAAKAKKDLPKLQAIQQELAERASLRSGLGGAFNALPQQQQEGVMAAANGGIVAFAGDEEENDSTTGQLVSSPGNPRLHQQYGDRMLEVIKRMESDKGYTPMTRAERLAAEKVSFDELNRFAGEDPYGSMKERLKDQEADRSGALAQSRGLAALQAAAALSQGRGLIQGLGRAGGAFADSYGQALRADAAEKRAISQMQFNLADAQRKERLGLTKEARADVQASETARYNAAKAAREKDAAIGNMLGKGLSATRITGQGAKPLKINEQLAAAEIAYEKDPSEANKQQVTALRRAVSQTRTSDIGGTRAGVETFRTLSTANANEQKLVNSKKFTDPDWMAAYEKNDPQAIAAAEDAILRRIRASAPATPGSVNNNSPQRQQNDYSNLWQ